MCDKLSPKLELFPLHYTLQEPNGEPVKNNLLLKAIEGIGTQGLDARVVVTLKVVGQAFMFLDMVPVKFEKLTDVCDEEH